MSNRRAFGLVVLSLTAVVGACSGAPSWISQVAKVARAKMAPDELLESYQAQFQLRASPPPRPGAGVDRSSEEASALAASSVDHFEDVAAGIRPVFSARPGLKAADVILPSQAGRPFGLTDRESGVSVNVELLDTQPVAAARSSSGYVIYPGAHASGATLLELPRPDGVEDYLPLDSLPGSEAVTYRVTLKGAVAGLRFISNSLEFLDRQGTPRLRMNPPSVLGGDGNDQLVDVHVTGCAFDTSPVAPWGRQPVTPGSDTCLVKLSWSGVAYPALLDPAWVTAGANVIARRQGAAIAPVGTAT